MLHKLQMYFLWFLAITIFSINAEAFFAEPILNRKEAISTLRLKQIDSHPQFFTIPYQGYELIISRGKSPAQSSAVDFAFGELSKPQFDFLKSTYGGKKSILAYKKARRYKLTEFFPPLLQSLSGFYFTPETNLNGELIAVNCWAFALSFLRHMTGAAEDMTVFYVPENEFRQFIDLSQDFDVIAKPFKDSIGNPSARFGDLVLHRWIGGIPGYIDHVSVYIDQNLYFEKVGPGPDQPFRLHSFPASSVSGTRNFEFLRLKPEAIIAHPKENFKSKTQCFFGQGIISSHGEMPYLDVVVELDLYQKARIPKKYKTLSWGTEQTTNFCPELK